MPTKSRTKFIIVSSLAIVSCWIFIIGRNNKVSRSFIGSEDPLIWESPGTVNFSKPKRILLWTTYYRNQPSVWGNNFYRIVSRNCPVNYCDFVFNPRLVHTADAVLFHSSDLACSYEFPAQRSPNQVWVFFSMEPATMMSLDHSQNISVLSGVFNWTMTYRSDSEVRVPFGKLVEHDALTLEKKTLSNRDFWSVKNKSLMVMWSANVCFTFSNRESYVRELARYITVDLYGLCNNRSCGSKYLPSQMPMYDEEDERCNRIISKYMFYLAFEESLCIDYITEKIFVAMQYGAVPIVLGVANYTEYVPQDSFIDALQFQTARHLASYLLKVAEDKTLYNSYFAWKSAFKVDLGHPYNMHACELCSKLYEIEINKTTSTPVVIEDFSSWLTSSKMCYEYVPLVVRENGAESIQPLVFD